MTVRRVTSAKGWGEVQAEDAVPDVTSNTVFAASRHEARPFFFSQNCLDIF